MPLRWNGSKIVGLCTINPDGTFTAHDLDKSVRDLIGGDTFEFSVGYIPVKADA